MQLLHGIVDVVLHLDRHLVELLAQHGAWLYAILFAIVFAETGFVVTPFLPGDSLLFAAGALAAVDASGTLRLLPLLLLLTAAAIGGNTLNFAIGRLVGPRAFSGRSRLLRREHLERTELFFRRHGALAIVLSRFVPIVRTFAPFVAGIGRMPYVRFQAFNFAGGAGWVLLMCVGGYLFGNLPWVKQHFGLVTLAIIVVSVVPIALSIVRDRRAAG
jgi:membrane-associated protein